MFFYKRLILNIRYYLAIQYLSDNLYLRYISVNNLYKNIPNLCLDRYEEFHGQQLDIVAKYPNMVFTEITNYDKAVCKFFDVDRRHPDVSCMHACLFFHFAFGRVSSLRFLY